MRRHARSFTAGATARLWVRDAQDRTEYWTETVGQLPAVYGERWSVRNGRTVRAFEPGRSKLAAALARGWDGPLPEPGEEWLYLGAASGSTASHVADLVGPDGAVVAVEKSPRPFVRLLAVAERWPNLLPVLGDARDPANYDDLVVPADGIYADVAQPDQVDIVLANARRFLDPSRGKLVVALKTPSMGRQRSAPAHLRAAEDALGQVVVPASSVSLEPFHRGHFLVGGYGEGAARTPRGEADAPRRAAWAPEAARRRPARRPYGRRPGRRGP